jgi:ribosomal protein S6--L-glutamate ligase
LPDKIELRENLVAIAPLLGSCPGLITLGVRPSMGDYTPRERELLLSARRIFFPTPRFAGILEAAGKETFPSAFAYRVRKSRLIQEVLFQFLKCPHPRTRAYYGRQKNWIVDDFPPPFLAMGPQMLSGVRRIASECDLQVLSEIHNPLIINEIVEYRERLEFVFVNYECAGILKRVPSGGQCEFDCPGIPGAARLANGEVAEYSATEVVPRLKRLLRSVRLNDIAVEIGITPQGWQLIEFVRPPLSWPSHEGVIDRFRYICSLIETERL